MRHRSAESLLSLTLLLSWGNLQFVDHPWEERYKTWADEVAKIYGGLDIVSIDVLHGKDGKECVTDHTRTIPG